MSQAKSKLSEFEKKKLAIAKKMKKRTTDFEKYQATGDWKHILPYGWKKTNN